MGLIIWKNINWTMAYWGIEHVRYWWNYVIDPWKWAVDVHYCICFCLCITQLLNSIQPYTNWFQPFPNQIHSFKPQIKSFTNPIQPSEIVFIILINEIRSIIQFKLDNFSWWFFTIFHYFFQLIIFKLGTINMELTYFFIFFMK